MKRAILALLVALNLFLIAFLFIQLQPDAYLWREVPIERARRVVESARLVAWVKYALLAGTINLGAVGVWLVIFHTRMIRVLGTALLGAVICSFFGARSAISSILATHYVVIFEGQAVSEQYILDPIRQAGPRAGPLLVANIQDRSYPHRRYAIRGLGLVRYEPAIPVLSAILQDTTEPFYIRGEALAAIERIGTDPAMRSVTLFLEGLDPQAKEEFTNFVSAIQ